MIRMSRTALFGDGEAIPTLRRVGSTSLLLTQRTERRVAKPFWL